MRKLTIKRIKSFVGSLGTLKVYVEDPESSTKIKDIPVRILGIVHNGSEMTFVIPNEQVRIVAIMDSLSKNFCYDIYTIPQGEEDVALQGKNIADPMLGNPFRFDNNEYQMPAKDKKKYRILYLLAILVCTGIGAAIGYLIVHFLF